LVCSHVRWLAHELAQGGLKTLQIGIFETVSKTAASRGKRPGDVLPLVSTLSSVAPAGTEMPSGG